MSEDKPGSRIPGFYNLSRAERLALLAEKTGLAPEDLAAFNPEQGLSADQADHMIENVVGLHALPLGIALNFQVNGRDVLVPMAIEEPSVVAAASYAAKMVRDSGGFQTSSTSPVSYTHLTLPTTPYV